MSDRDLRDPDRRDRMRDLISQEAAEWFARMQDPHVSEADRRAFWRWVKTSNLHVAEYLALAHIHGQLQAAPLVEAHTNDADSNVVPLHAPTDSSPTEQQPQTSDATPWRWRIAAAVAIIAVTSLLFLATGSVWLDRTIETELGEWKTAKLTDGSQVQLGPNTLLKLRLNDDRRHIRLLRGEAYFEVARDPTRPFLVTANDYVVRAVGTAFAVSRRGEELIVTVTEGVVRVAPDRNPAAERHVEAPLELSVPVVADYQLRVGRAWPVTPSPIDVRSALAWKDRRLTFQGGDTLADAVAEFNLRNRLQLELGPGAPATVPVRGTFSASDPRAFAKTMDRTPIIRVVEVAPDTLRIMSR
jgi:transmembrane sensor